MFLLAAGLGILASGLLGRVAGWSGVLIGASCLLVTLATRVDPVQTNPVPFLAGLLWTLAVSITLAWRGPRPSDVERPERTRTGRTRLAPEGVEVSAAPR